jgi:hypothetical protein
MSWFTRKTLIWSTSTSYDHKRDLNYFQIEYCRMNTASKLGPHTQTDRGTCPGVGP